MGNSLLSFEIFIISFLFLKSLHKLNIWNTDSYYFSIIYIYILFYSFLLLMAESQIPLFFSCFCLFLCSEKNYFLSGFFGELLVYWGSWGVLCSVSMCGFHYFCCLGLVDNPELTVAYFSVRKLSQLLLLKNITFLH